MNCLCRESLQTNGCFNVSGEVVCLIITVIIFIINDSYVSVEEVISVIEQAPQLSGLHRPRAQSLEREGGAIYRVYQTFPAHSSQGKAVCLRGDRAQGAAQTHQEHTPPLPQDAEGRRKKCQKPGEVARGQGRSQRAEAEPVLAAVAAAAEGAQRESAGH